MKANRWKKWCSYETKWPIWPGASNALPPACLAVPSTAVKRIWHSNAAVSRRNQPHQRPRSDTEALQYRLMSAVPDYWIPFLPVRPDPASAQMRLRRGAMAGPDGTAAPLSAQSRILLPAPGTPLDLYEEEVPREGATVTRTYQLARWIDGSTHLWVGRGKQIGRGEASSGLRFDLATRI